MIGLADDVEMTAAFLRIEHDQSPDGRAPM